MTVWVDDIRIYVCMHMYLCICMNASVRIYVYMCMCACIYMIDMDMYVCFYDNKTGISQAYTVSKIGTLGIALFKIDPCRYRYPQG